MIELKQCFWILKTSTIPYPTIATGTKYSYYH